MRTFLLHLLMYAHHKKLDPRDYVAEYRHGFMNSDYFKALNFLEWYRDERSFKLSIANGKKYINKKSEEELINFVTVIVSYTQQSFEAYQLITNDGSFGEEFDVWKKCKNGINSCLLYTSPSPRDTRSSRMPSSA